jgi:hypothetical protein
VRDRDDGYRWVVSDATVMAAVRDYGARLLEQARLAVAASAIGADETAFTRASAVKPTVFAAGVVDLHRVKLIDIVAGRSRKVLADWLFDQSTEWTAGIEVAALDPVPGLGFACVDDVRRRVQQPPMAIAAAAVTHCMASAGCCAAGPRT